MANIGKLTVDLTLASQKFEAGVKRVNARVATMRRHIASATASMGGMQARVAGLVGAAGLAALVGNSLKSADAIGKMSDRLGIATEDLSAFHHLAQLNGESSENFDKSLQKMTRSIGEFGRDFGTGKKAFEDLGISIEDLQGKNPAQQFQIIGDAIKGVGDKTQQASLAADIFGRSGIDLLNTINQGSEGFERAKAEVEKYGLAISRVDASKIEAANDALLRSQQALKGVSLAATVELAPVIEEVADKFTEAAISGEGFASKVKGGLLSASSVIGLFADGIRGIHVLLKAVEVAAIGIGTVFTRVFDFLVNDVLVKFANAISNMVLAPIRAVLSFAADFSDQAQVMLDSINMLGKAEGFETLRNVGSYMTDSLKSSAGELHDLMMETIPSEAMAEKIEAIFAGATERAKEVVENIGTDSKVVIETEIKTTSDEPNKNEKSKPEQIAEEKSFLEQMANIRISSSKKVAAAQKLIRLKTAIVDGFAAVQAAWALPYPANIPAIALAVASTAANIAGIKGVGSFIGGGYIPDGVRANGVDGKGGQVHILHPDESIIDHKKGQSVGGGGRGITINQSPVFYGSDSNMVFEALAKDRKKTARLIQSMQGLPA